MKDIFIRESLMFGRDFKRKEMVTTVRTYSAIRIILLND